MPSSLIALDNVDTFLLTFLCHNNPYVCCARPSTLHYRGMHAKHAAKRPELLPGLPCRMYAFDVHCNSYFPLFLLLYGAPRGSSLLLQWLSTVGHGVAQRPVFNESSYFFVPYGSTWLTGRCLVV